MKKINQKKLIKNPVVDVIVKLVVLSIASFILAFDVKSFVNAAGLYPAGFSGISILVQKLALRYADIQIPYSALYLPFNIVPVIIGFKHVGKQFTLWSLYVVVLSSVLTDIIPVIPVTDDTILLTIFGGLISGIGIVLTLIVGAGTGGTDFISIYFSEKKGIDVWNYILVFNVGILIAAGAFFGFDKALYSIIFQYVSTTVLNQAYKRYQKDTLLIITSKPMEIYHKIEELTNHGATLLKGTGCYELDEKDILYSVVGRAEVDMVTAAIKEIDPHAFVNIIKTEQVRGNFYKKPTK